MGHPIQFGRQALRAALEIRKRAGKANSEPVCVFDLAESLGIEVKFFCGNSFEGMYAPTTQTVLVPSLRPPGRQAFTCAHELGHWYFKHGTRIEELKFLDLHYNRKPDEQLANLFAAHLLMPSWAVKQAFLRRGYEPRTCTALDVYKIRGQLGVGYSTLVKHLRSSLELIDSQQARTLLKTTPKQIRNTVLGGNRTRHLIVADRAWSNVPIDLQVGDMAILPAQVTVDGTSVYIADSQKIGLLVEGRLPGIARTESQDGSWATFIRVSRKNFEGRSIYRHLEDPDVD